MFICCEKCGKKLIERMPNGLWRFRFGTAHGKDKRPIVDMVINGSIKMRCIRRGCDHENVLNYIGTSRDGTYRNTAMNSFGAGLSTLYNPAFVGNEIEPVDLNLNATGVTLAIVNGSGGVRLNNLGNDDFLYIYMTSGSVELTSTVLGTIRLYGSAKLIDNSDIGATVINEMNSVENITDSLLNEPMASHNIIGTFGNWMKKILYKSK